MKTPNQRMIVSDIRTLPGMDSRDILVPAGKTSGTRVRPCPLHDSRDILVPAGSAMARYDSRGFPARANTQVQYFRF